MAGDRVGGEPSYYVVCAHREYRVRDELDRLGIDNWLPECRVVSSQRRVIITKTGPLFPGYLFVHVVMTGEVQRIIQDVRWVDGILRRDGDRPAPINSAAVQTLRQLIIDCGGRVLIKNGLVERGYGGPDSTGRFTPGQQVRVLHGPFSGFNALFTASEGRDRVKILLDIFGRVSETSLLEASIEAVS